MNRKIYAYGALFLVILFSLSADENSSKATMNYLSERVKSEDKSLIVLQDVFNEIKKNKDDVEKIGKIVLEQLKNKADFFIIKRALDSGFTLNDLYVLRPLIYTLCVEMPQSVIECKDAFNDYKDGSVDISSACKEIITFMDDCQSFLQASELLGLHRDILKNPLSEFLCSLFDVKKEDQANMYDGIVSWMTQSFSYIKHDYERMVWWDTLEKVFFAGCDSQELAIKSIAASLKKLYEGKMIIIPSFSYCMAVVNAHIPLLGAFPDSVVRHIFSKEQGNLMRERRRSTYIDRLKNKGLENEETPFFLAYDFLRDINLTEVPVVVIGGDGWTTELIVALSKMPTLFDEKEKRFNRPLIMTVPYFNAYNAKNNELSVDQFILSDLITLILLARARFEQNDEEVFRVIPVFSPTINDDPGIAPIAAYIGKLAQKMVISFGSVDATYGAVDQDVDVPGEIVYEPYLPLSDNHTLYLTPEHALAFLANQQIQGNPDSFWSCLRRPSFLYGGVDIGNTESAVYRIVSGQGKEERLFLSLPKIKAMQSDYMFSLAVSLGGVSEAQMSNVNPATVPFGFMHVPPKSVGVFSCDASGFSPAKYKEIVT